MTTNEHPPRPPRAGYYWQLDAAGWREVRPVNWYFLQQYYARKAKEHNNDHRGSMDRHR